jgi:OOP family OmpA-OmpF porin
MSFKNMAVAATFGMACAAGSHAIAQPVPERGWYIGGSIGQSDIDQSAAIPGLITSGTVDGKDTAYKAFGGYMFNRNFGAEVSYVSLGELTYSGEFFGAPVTGGTIEASGFNVSAVAVFPVSTAFSVFGKVGFLRWEAEASDTTGGVPFSEEGEGTDLSFGLGLSYSFTRNLAARAEWERFEIDGADADLLSVGLVYRF